MRVALVTNMPAPYRVPGLNFVHRRLQNDFKVFFCTLLEPNRQWTVGPMEFQHVFLEENVRLKKDGSAFIHNNSDIYRKLKSFQPDVVITGGFNPTMLYAFFYTVLHRKKHIPLSDAWAVSEQHLSALHRILRRFVYRFSSAFIACSIKGKAYFESLGAGGASIFISHYTIDNDRFAGGAPFSGRKWDLLFSGQFTERKNPLFFVEVATLISRRKKGLKVLLLGDGPLRETVLQKLRENNISFDYPGYARQEDLPGYYTGSKLFLFPTSNDAWGVVANEAASAGTPVLVTPYAGCAEELIIHDRNGFVLPLEPELWAAKCLSLLEDETKWAVFSGNARESALRFTHENAASALYQACEFAIAKRDKTTS